MPIRRKKREKGKGKKKLKQLQTSNEGGSLKENFRFQIKSKEGLVDLSVEST